MEIEGQARIRRALVDMELSTFQIPPSGEVLVVGKRAAIGPKAAERMTDSVTPGQFELVEPEDDLIDGILIKKELLLRADKETLIKTIVEESKPIMTDYSMVTIKCDIRVIVRREL